MSEYYHIVPWFNSEEWHEVYNKIYITSNLQEALNCMQIWKARCPSLPSGIESTLVLLEVHLQDIKLSEDIDKDQFLRLAYSSAIMRFVNHMLDTDIAKGASLYQAAQNLGVPDWIIDLRHDTAHSNNLPSISLLREASMIGLKWLRENYWEKYKVCIEDFTTGSRNIIVGDESKILLLMQFCTSLSICVHSKIKKVTDIPDANMRESIISDAGDLFGINVIDNTNTNPKTVSIASLVNLIHEQSKTILKGRDVAGCVTKALLGEDSLFLSLELLQYLSDHEFTYKNRLNISYVQCYELLLTYLHTHDLLLEFILELVHITQVGEDKDRNKLAALWLSEIFKALHKSKVFIDKINKINSSDLIYRKKKELKSLYHHWFPNEKNNILLLDLHKSVPAPLLNIEFIQPIISSYNPYLTYFIADILNLVEPHLPKEVKDKICKLANVISSPEKLSNFASKIYTVDDLKCNILNTEMEIEDEEQIVNVPHEQYKPNECGDWKLSTIEFDWSTCPIGQKL